MNYLFFDIECCDGQHICEFGYVLADEMLNVIEKNHFLMNPEAKFNLIGRPDREDLHLYYDYEVYYRSPITYKLQNGRYSHQIIIYDSVPGGAGHSRRLVTETGDVLRTVIARAVKILSECDCDPSCYKCLRSYENQKSHEILNRKKALEFLKQFM